MSPYSNVYGALLIRVILLLLRWMDDMKGLGVAAATAAVIAMGYAGGVQAADLDTLVTKAPVTKAPAAPASCSSPQDFFLTACQLAWYGVRFYGTVDIGYGYQTHGAPFDGNFVTGASYFIQKMNRTAMWGLAPNGLSQSNIGVQIKEPLGLGWSFVGQLEAGFDPYSLRFANSPGAEVGNIGVPIGLQTTNGDSSRAGQWYNSLGFVGISNDTYGTLTVFRQNSFTNDLVTAYDPMGGAYAFSPIGFSGTVAGGGDTENAKYSTSVKYKVNIANFRLGALYQFGGYDLDNGSKEAWGGDVGGDFRIGPGILSVDVAGGYNKDAVNLGLGASATAFNAMTATLSDNTNVMVAAKYTVDRLKLYAGYEWMQFASPSDPITGTGNGFTDVAGDFVCAGCNVTGPFFNGTNINNTAYSASAGFKDKILQVVWAGARYSVTDSVDVAVAAYHYDQNQFTASNAAGNTISAGCATNQTSNSACSGTMNAASIMIDWKFAPKWDTYIGTFYSEMNGGLDNSYLSKNNLATTAGIRFRF
jgi:predicted porin